uniref:NADH-ubiquinone oxidoreductase chain 6 n=1 Tax=Podagricomela nigricollis TaxID=2528270 RepID=A0A411NH38_9CUCU|nr:NADH dehydrogenase subunit 6 [Podagricomela nigricollis]QBF44008.1 NADH dehydrogenase subunit 6 [Podagricomela nigricollis]
MFMYLPLMIMCSIFIIFMKHPLTYGLILLIQTIFTTMITGLLSYNYWYSYILFLIMIGGMLILFIYMTSIASNEKFKFNNKLLFLMFIMLLMFLILMLLDNFYFNYFSSMSDISLFNNMKNLNNSMNKYLNYPNNMIIFSMIIYLLITLIAIVKITNFSYGPLRQKF